MKKVLYAITALVLVVLAGCNKDDSNPVDGPASVTFRVTSSAIADTVYFSFKPDTDVKIDTIIASLPAKNFVDYYAVNESNRVFSKDVLYQWIGYSGVQSGQKWSFVFKGRLVSNNSSFSYSYSYSIP